MADEVNPWLLTKRVTLEELDGTAWTGEGELWLDPLGDSPNRYPCKVEIEGQKLSYTWAKDDKPHQGHVTWSGEGGEFQDSFHQPTATACYALTQSKAELALGLDYDPGEGPPWGWQILVSVRPMGQLVLQMTNVAPWGEEARAVRMVLTRA